VPRWRALARRGEYGQCGDCIVFSGSLDLLKVGFLPYLLAIITAILGSILGILGPGTPLPRSVRRSASVGQSLVQCLALRAITSILFLGIIRNESSRAAIC